MGREKHPLRTWLFEHGETASEFAVRIGVRQSNLPDWLNRKRDPSMKSMVKVAKATAGAVMPNDFMPPNWRRKS